MYEVAQRTRGVRRVRRFLNEDVRHTIRVGISRFGEQVDHRGGRERPYEFLDTSTGAHAYITLWHRVQSRGALYPIGAPIMGSRTWGLAQDRSLRFNASRTQ